MPRSRGCARVADELDARIVIAPGGAAAARTRAAHAGPERPPAAACRTVRRVCVAPLPAGACPAALQALGLLRPGFSAIGALGCESRIAQLLARHGAALIGCPQAELRLGAAPRATPGACASRPRLGTDTPAAAALSTCSPKRAAPRCSSASRRRGAAPRDARRRARARARDADRLDRARQVRRSRLHRPRRPPAAGRDGCRGGHRVRCHPRAGERRVERGPRRGERRAPAALR